MDTVLERATETRDARAFELSRSSQHPKPSQSLQYQNSMRNYSDRFLSLGAGVRSRVALSLGAYHESGDWKYGRKVVSVLRGVQRPLKFPFLKIEWVIRCRARTIDTVLESHGRCESLERSIVQIGDWIRNRVTRRQRNANRLLQALDSFATTRETPDELQHDLALLRSLEDELGAGATRRAQEDVPDDDLPELAICLREEIETLRASLDDQRRAVAALESGDAQADLPPPPPRR